jgi:O-antigen/teichoic acid export membrane protein
MAGASEQRQRRRGSSANASRVPTAGHASYRSGFAFGVLSFLAVVAFGVVSTIVTARIYGVDVIGQFAIAWAPVAVLWVLSTVKEQAALIREITCLPPRHPRITELFAAVFSFSTALTVCVSLLVGVVASVIFAGPLHHRELIAPMLASLAGYAVVTNTCWNVDSIFSAFVAGRQLFWVRLHETLGFLLIAITVGLAWRSVWGLVIAMIGASLGALIHRAVVVRSFVTARLAPGGYRRGMQALPGLLRFGLKVTPGAIAQGLSQQAGIWAIASFAPTVLVGAYSRAQTVPDRLQQVNFRIDEVLYPTLVGRRARGDGPGFDRALLDTIRYGLMGMFAVASVCGGAGHAILSLFGPGFVRATGAFALLIAYPALAVIASAQTQALLALDRPALTSVIATARMVTTIPLTVLLTPAIGIAGPAVALLGGFLVDIAWKTCALAPCMSSPLSQTWPRRQRAALLSAYACGFLAAFGVAGAASSLGRLALGLVLGSVCYSAALYAGGAINGRDRERLREGIALARRLRQARRRRLEPAPT